MSTNQAVAVDLSLAIAREDWTRAGALLADDFLSVGDGRPALDKAEYLHLMRHVLQSGTVELHVSFSRCLAEGPLVALEYTNTRLHGRTLPGMPVTVRRIIASGHLVREVKAGQVTREWQSTDAARLMAQLRAPYRALRSGGTHG